jgi:hypothetical protein
MAYGAPRAVIVARYENRMSQMLLWETDRDVVYPGQWVGGGVSLLDVSADGRYVAYAVEAPGKSVPHYLVVSRPPYLSARFFQPVRKAEWARGFFHPRGGFYWSGPLNEGERWGEENLEEGRIADGCPFEIERMESYRQVERLVRERDLESESVRNALRKHGWRAGALLTNPYKGAGLHPGADEALRRVRNSMTLATWDHQGRLVVCYGSGIYAFREGSSHPKTILNQRKARWTQVETPEWALAW